MGTENRMGYGSASGGAVTDNNSCVQVQDYRGVNLGNGVINMGGMYNKGCTEHANASAGGGTFSSTLALSVPALPGLQQLSNRRAQDFGGLSSTWSPYAMNGARLGFSHLQELRQPQDFGGLSSTWSPYALDGVKLRI